MSSKPASHRVFFVFALLAALVLASLPVQARPVRRSAPSVTVSGATVLSGLWRFVVSLWPGVTAKEGTSIDPNGSPNHGSTPVTPTGSATNDEGMSIDPDGSK
jgi:hypothetical protein